MSEVINYPSTVNTDFEKLSAVYSLLEQARLEHNRQGELARSDWAKNKDKWYLFALRPKRLGGNTFWDKVLPLLQEQNRLKRNIRKANYTDEQWHKLDDEERNKVTKQLFGDKEILKDEPTEATCTLLDELKGMSFESLEGKAPDDPIEDFTTYTEVDPNSDFTITSSKIAVDGLRRDAAAYVYKDMGSGHFGDFEHLLKITKSASFEDFAVLGWWGLSNVATTFYGMDVANVGLVLLAYSATTELVEMRDFDTGGVDYMAGGDATKWLTVERAGTTATCKIYSDAERTSLDDTLSITCATTTYQYILGTFSRESSNNGEVEAYGDIEDLDLQEGATEKSSSDSGNGAEAKTGYPTATLTKSETGSGSDILSQAQAILDAAEAGSGVDAKSDYPEAVLTKDETGSGADAYVSLESQQAKASSDTGYGLEGTPVPSAILAGSEAGSAIEALIFRLLAAVDTSYGFETGAEIEGLLKNLFASELGEGSDSLTAKIEMPTKGGGMKLWT